MNKICVLPWIHLNVNPSGSVSPCCNSQNFIVGNLESQSIPEIWNGIHMKSIRNQMLNGKEPDSCKSCYNKERLVGESVRLHRNNFFKESLDVIPSLTLNDGTCTEMKLKYWDFRFSNVCNFKCRSCCPESSSAWISDAKKLNWNINVISNPLDFKFIEDQIYNVEFISFAGGEPLLMDEHWRILDLLIEKKRFINLKYNTNCSLLTYKGKSVLDYWSKFDNVRISPSIDEVGNRAELIRYGTVWSDIENNIKILLNVSKILIQVHITVSALNVFRLPEIIDYLKNIGVEQFHLNILQYPSHYHVSILPDLFRNEIIEKLSDPFYTIVVNELKKPYDINSAKEFVDITRKLDSLRNENTFKTIPELHFMERW
jgi:radical SAM protein with 4Fe4S-binding SPASM domain